LSLRAAKCCSIVFDVTLRLASCHKHFVVFSRNQHRRLLPATCHNLRAVAVVHRRPCLQHLACCSVKRGSQARYRLRVAISAYSTRIRRPRYGGSSRNIAMPFGMEKLEWRACLSDGEKILMICLFVLTQLTNVTDRQTYTHRQTPHDGIGRAYA